MTQSPNDADVIAPHSDSLCRQFNQDYPTTVLNIARFFIGFKDQSKHIISASVVQVCQDDLKIDGETLKGERLMLSVSFPDGPMQSLAMAREAFLDLGKKADRGLLHQTALRPIPGQPTGLKVYWPKWSPFLITLAASVSSFFYMYFFPDTKIPLLQWTMEKVGGYGTVRSCVHFAVFLHAFQTATAIHLMRNVSAYRFSWKQMVVWCVCVQFLGIGSMLKLLPIVYNSKFVQDENLMMEKKGEGYYLDEEAALEE
ncbi:hypothetical protein KI688_004952 [Linnemannia hyalina]|uniref:DUF2470 domain-containing protein n=1 Tax=Linnemannia hyalina TaxID=64524 RepID=A0A9P8BP15_9FUNG|nr:hypothetical protein KI688_004952 [Linnemannia hyalina]